MTECISNQFPCVPSSLLVILALVDRFHKIKEGIYNIKRELCAKVKKEESFSGDKKKWSRRGNYFRSVDLEPDNRKDAERQVSRRKRGYRREMKKKCDRGREETGERFPWTIEEQRERCGWIVPEGHSW